MPTIKSLQQLHVIWAREIYTVSQSTLDIADRKRTCWVCGNPFRIGDGMTVVCTTHGNRLTHSRCYKAAQV